MTQKSPDPKYMTMTFEGVSREAVRLFGSIYRARGGPDRPIGEVLSELFYEKSCELFSEKGTESIIRDYLKYQQHLESLDRQ